MKENFTLPVCEVITFDNEDVITASYSGSNVEVGNNGNSTNLPNVGFFD